MLTLTTGGQIAIITQGHTPLDELASVRLRGDLVEDMRALLGALGLGEGTA